MKNFINPRRLLAFLRLRRAAYEFFIQAAGGARVPLQASAKAIYPSGAPKEAALRGNELEGAMHEGIYARARV